MLLMECYYLDGDEEMLCWNQLKDQSAIYYLKGTQCSHIKALLSTLQWRSIASLNAYLANRYLDTMFISATYDDYD